MTYINRENEVEIGLFKRGYLILMEKQRKSLITVEKENILTTSFLDCPIVHFKNEIDVAPLHRVLSYVSLVLLIIALPPTAPSKKEELPSEWNKRTKTFIRDLLYII